MELLIIIAPLLIATIYALYIGVRSIRHNIIQLALIITFIVYVLITPTVYWMQDTHIIVNKNVKEYFSVGMGIATVWLVTFILAYHLPQAGKLRSTIDLQTLPLVVAGDINKSVFGMAVLIFILIYINTLAGGANLIDIFLGLYGAPTLGLQGYSYYIQNLADSLITVILIGICTRMNRKILIAITVAAVTLFLILGFRYRIVLLFMGASIIFTSSNKITFRKIIYGLAAVIVFLIALLNITNNRASIYMQDFDSLNISLTDLPYNAITDQAKGSLVDFAIYKSVSEGSIKIDYGETWLLYTLIKASPSFFFQAGAKPYPPPQLAAIDQAIAGTRDHGEASTVIGGSFYSFHMGGVILSALLAGYGSRYVQRRMRVNLLHYLFASVFACSLFQLITRGYLPQFIDHLLYLSLPLLVLRNRLKRISSPILKTGLTHKEYNSRPIIKKVAINIDGTS